MSQQSVSFEEGKRDNRVCQEAYQALSVEREEVTTTCQTLCGTLISHLGSYRSKLKGEREKSSSLEEQLAQERNRSKEKVQSVAEELELETGKVISLQKQLASLEARSRQQIAGLVEEKDALAMHWLSEEMLSLEHALAQEKEMTHSLKATISSSEKRVTVSELTEEGITSGVPVDPSTLSLYSVVTLPVSAPQESVEVEEPNVKASGETISHAPTEDLPRNTETVVSTFSPSSGLLSQDSLSPVGSPSNIQVSPCGSAVVEGQNSDRLPGPPSMAAQATSSSSTEPLVDLVEDSAVGGKVAEWVKSKQGCGLVYLQRAPPASAPRAFHWLIINTVALRPADSSYRILD